MKGLWILSIVFLSAIMTANPVLPRDGYRYPEIPLMGGMMLYNMMLQDDSGCPMMMDLLRSVDSYLFHKEEIGLSEGQLRSLKTIRDFYQKDVITMTANLHKLMLELNNLLSEDEIDLSKAKMLNEDIESIQAEMRFKNIEAFVRAKRILTKEQVKKVRLIGKGYLEAEHHPGMMHR